MLSKISSIFAPKVGLENFWSVRYIRNYAACKVLKLNNNCTEAEVKVAYLKLSKLYHPDNNETGDKDRFLLIKDAFDALMRHKFSKNPEDSLNETVQLEEDLSHAAFIRQRNITLDYFNDHRQKFMDDLNKELRPSPYGKERKDVEF